MVEGIRRLLGGAGPYLILCVGAFSGGSNSILGRAVEGHVPPIGLSFWRWVFAALVLYPFIHHRVRAQWPLLLGRWRALTFLSFCMVILGNTSIYLGLQWTTAINAGVVMAAHPAFVIALSWLIHRERFGGLQGLGVGIALMGVLAIVTRGDPSLLLELKLNRGDLWITVSVLGFALYTTLLKTLDRDIDFLVYVFAVQVLGMVMLAPIYAWESLYHMPMKLDWITIGAVAWVATVVANLGLMAWNAGILAVGPAKASVFVYVRLLFIAAMALVLLGERIETFHVVGALSIIAGLYLVTRRTAK